MKVILRPFRTLLVVVVALATASCGFHLRGSYNLPEEIQQLSLTSYDKYSKLTREMKGQLRLHDIEMVEPSEGIANLNLAGESYGEATLSLYQNNRVAEKSFTYRANYSVTVPEKGNYRFSIALNRTYLDNPLSALAKSVEQDMLASEMRTEATKQIMRQLSRMTAHIDEFEKKKAEEALLKSLYMGADPDKPELTIETRYEGQETPDGLMIPDAPNPPPGEQGESGNGLAE